MKEINEISEIKKDEKGVAVVDFYAEWCAPCKIMGTILSELEPQFSEIADFFKLDIDESPDAAVEYNVRSIPTVIVFKNGTPAETFTGVQPAEKIAAAITESVQGKASVPEELQKENVR